MVRNTVEELSVQLFQRGTIADWSGIKQLINRLSDLVRSKIGAIKGELAWNLLSSDDSFVERISSPIKVQNVKPHLAFYGMNIVGVDASSIPLRVHPFRLIIARSGVYARSLKVKNRLEFKGPYKIAYSTLEYLPGMDVEETIRTAEARLLAEVEAVTAIDFIDKHESLGVDLLIIDGPMYHPRTFDIDIEFVMELKDIGVPAIYVVKNSSSRRLAKLMGLEMLDADILSVLLKPGERTPLFVVKDAEFFGKSQQLPEPIRPVSFYYMSPKHVLFRFDIPYWVFEELGTERIVELAVAEILSGGGDKSLMVSMAESVAKFSKSEREYLRACLESLLSSQGVLSPRSFNQLRWGVYKW